MPSPGELTAPWHRRPNTLATIAARSRLPVASSRTWMVDNGSTGIRRPLTMIRSTWSRSGVATTTSPVGPTACTPSKISTSTPWTTARALRTARTSPRSQRARRSPRRRATHRPVRPRLRDQPGDPGPWDRPAIHGGRGRRFRRQPTCHVEQWAARPGPHATLVLIRSRRPAFHVAVASYRHLGSRSLGPG
jgi:hypothetical protein